METVQKGGMFLVDSKGYSYWQSANQAAQKPAAGGKK